MITKPTLFLDEKKCKRNILAMAAKADKLGLQFRPHFKTHQSLKIGKWFKEAGVSKIAVSSVTMAEYFAGEWDDITIAFPVNILEIDAINALAKKTGLNLLVENEESIDFLQQHLASGVNAFIKIDVGSHRTGLDPNDLSRITGLLNMLDECSRINFSGFLGHAGHTYQCRSSQEIAEVHAKTLAIMTKLRGEYVLRYPDLIISLGDTPSCSVAEDFTGVDEFRPGNFVFYDLMQHQIGSCAVSDIAVALACPVVAIHDDRSELVVYGGGVHLSKDRMEEQGRTIYGKLVQKTKKGWGDLIPGAYVKSISQEHGIISVMPEDLENYQIGDYVLILPVHSCMTADLMRGYTVLNSCLPSFRQ